MADSLERALERDPKWAKDIRIAGAVARELLVRVEIERGATAAEAEARVQALMRLAPKQASLADLRRVAKLADAALAAALEPQIGLAPLVERAATAESNASLAGFGDEAAKIIGAAAIAISLTLMVAKLGAKDIHVLGGAVSFAEGVPEDFGDVTGPLVKLATETPATALAQAARAAGAKPDAGPAATKPPAAASAGGGSTGGAAAPAATAKGASQDKPAGAPAKKDPPPKPGKQKPGKATGGGKASGGKSKGGTPPRSKASAGMGHNQGPPMNAAARPAARRKASKSDTSQPEAAVSALLPAADLAPSEPTPAASAIIASNHIGPLTVPEARALGAELLARFHRRELLAGFLPTGGASRKLFATGAKPVAGQPWRHFDAPFTLGVGTETVFSPAGRPLGERVALRVQAPAIVLPSVLEDMDEELTRAFGRVSETQGRVGVRWIGPVTCLPDDGSGPGRWEARRGLKNHVGLGSPVSLGTDQYGALTWAWRSGDRIGALTVGHIVPPGHERDALPVHHHRIPRPIGAVLHAERMLPGYLSNIGGAEALRSSDHAILALEPGYVMPWDQLFGAEGGRVDTTILHAPLQTRQAVRKLAAKTKGAGGVVRARNVRLEMLDPLTSGVVVGDGLIEIEMEEDFVAKPGDSGSLIVVGDGPYQPAAMLVASTRAGRPASKDSNARCVIYALPLSAIPAVGEPLPPPILSGAEVA